MERKREKGFTLMELMVVIVIVAILAAVAVPLYVNYVKDAQRTKTHDGTTRTLSVIWGVRGHEAALAAATAWYRSLLEASGAVVTEVASDR